jgi:hypothetical protein
MSKRRVRPSLLVAILLVAITATGAASAGGAQHEGAEATAVLPIAASTTTPGTASVLIPMGHLDDPSNTFWEAFVRPEASSSWRLATPPGVASNGGLVMAAAPSGSLTVGFLTSSDLRFSPVAETSNGGQSWSPGELPSPLAAVPSALAVAMNGEALALVTGAGQRALMVSSSLSKWRTLTTTKEVEFAAAPCDLREMTAVVFNAASQPLAGLDCANSGEIGILVASSSTTGGQSGWNEIGPPIAAGDGASTVIRLVRTGEGVDGLAELRTGRRTSLVAFWGQGSLDRWSVSSPLSIPPGWSLQATSTGGGSGQGLGVLLGSGDQRRLDGIAGPGLRWTSPPVAPRGASGLAEIGRDVDTFVVSTSRLVVWMWRPDESGWRQAASISVPVPYGSSS